MTEHCQLPFNQFETWFGFFKMQHNNTVVGNFF